MNRIPNIRKALRKLNLHALVITHMPHVRYLTNFSGSNGVLIITPRTLHFITDGRYEEQVKTELFDLPGLKTHIGRDVWGIAKTKNIFKNCETAGFEAAYLTYARLDRMRRQMRPIKFKPVKNLVEPVVIPKTEDEIEHIRKAAAIGDKVFDHILGFIKPGMLESDVEAEISYQAKKLGSEGDAFSIIVASGPRSALPHGRASRKKIKKGEVITLDYGCIVNGFCSDMTRTFVIGKPKKLVRKVYDIVLQAELAAIEATRAGVGSRELDAIARNIIADAGYGDQFNHSLGHGLGIEVHEGPTLSKGADNEPIPSGAVVTIEPGIYLGGQFGVRIEDDVLALNGGNETLTHAPRELISL